MNKKYKFKGHISANNHSTGTKFELKRSSSRYSHISNIKSLLLINLVVFLKWDHVDSNKSLINPG